MYEMFAKKPFVTPDRNNRSVGELEFILSVGTILVLKSLEADVDFWGLEARIFDIEIEGNLRQILQ
jgi:hypothetical protein